MTATISPPATERPDQFEMTIQGGMLQSLGVNMYTTLGKCLTEFVANAYDGDAPGVSITIPFGQIEPARSKLKAEAKALRSQAKAENKPIDSYQLLTRSLPPEIVVRIEDKGHGMSWQEVRDKYLMINRRRRLDEAGQETNLKSEGGSRYVMGRKGLGKLAAFGAASRVVVTTKRRGENYETSFVLEQNNIVNVQDIGHAPVPATYVEGLPVDDSYTKIELSGLKSEAVKYSEDAIRNDLAEAFWAIDPKDFSIDVNGTPVVPPKVDYDFTYPPVAERVHEGLARATVEIEEIGSLSYDYAVYFRKPGEHLPAAKRGARIYCNHRLAAGPDLLQLKTGMHNFHAQAYLECVVRVDDLDRHSVDLINTNRTMLRDNPLVEKFIEDVTERMRQAIYEHSKHRDSVADNEIDSTPEGKQAGRQIELVPKRHQTVVRRLLRHIAARDGADSDVFREVAPMVVAAVNIGDVVLKLVEVVKEPEPLQKLIGLLHEITTMENTDALKHYRIRKRAISQLSAVIERGDEVWKSRQEEAYLHELLAQNPFLVSAEYTQYLTSNRSLETCVVHMARALEVDRHGSPTDAQRPDMVFLLADRETPAHTVVVELKSPSTPLDYRHLTQLENYMSKVRRYAKQHLRVDNLAVTGLLVGRMPKDGEKWTEAQSLLVDKVEREMPTAAWKVLTLERMLAMAVQAHSEVINALEQMDEAEQAQRQAG